MQNYIKTAKYQEIISSPRSCCPGGVPRHCCRVKKDQIQASLRAHLAVFCGVKQTKPLAKTSKTIEIKGKSDVSDDFPWLKDSSTPFSLLSRSFAIVVEGCACRPWS